MAYGGTPSGPPAAAGSSPAMKQVKLEKESELRIEVNFNSSLRLRLLNGTAEIFGTEMPPENWLIFPPRMKFAIFTWYGATIEMQDNTETDYVADETPMISYVNVHAVLEGRRNRAKASPSDSDASQGPRVIVVGPTDSGKSTLSRMLLSWAAKQGWKPTFVDLDIGQGSITLPGCIAASPIEMPIDPVEGIPLEMPLVYFFGHNTPTVNADLYRVLVKELAQILERQFAGNPESRAAGMVINTMGFIDGLGYDLLLHAIDGFLNPFLTIQMASISSSAIATVNRTTSTQASLAAPFTGLKSNVAFPVTKKANNDFSSLPSNGGRVQCMKVWPPIGLKKYETLSYLPPLSDEALSKEIDYLIRNKWIPCLEFELEHGFVYREHHHSPGYYDGRYWTMWKLPMFGCTDSAQVMKEVGECKKEYPNAFIRVIGFDNIRQVQCISFIVAKPPGVL